MACFLLTVGFLCLGRLVFTLVLLILALRNYHLFIYFPQLYWCTPLKHAYLPLHRWAHFAIFLGPCSIFSSFSCLAAGESGHKSWGPWMRHLTEGCSCLSHISVKIWGKFPRGSETVWFGKAPRCTGMYSGHVFTSSWQMVVEERLHVVSWAALAFHEGGNSGQVEGPD